MIWMARPYSATDGSGYVRDLERRLTRLERVGVLTGAAPFLRMVQANALMMALPEDAGHVYVQGVDPTETMDQTVVEGDVWKDTSYPQPIIRVWDGSVWLKSEDPALDRAVEAQGTTIDIYRDDEEPLPAHRPNGSLWQSPVTGVLMRWQADEWVETPLPGSGEMDVIRGEIDAVIISANGKNKITYTDVLEVNAPGPDPAPDPDRTDGDIHRNRDSLTKVIYKTWQWNGSSWDVTTFGGDILDWLDVGKLTAGAATIDTAVVNKLYGEVVESRRMRTEFMELGDPTNWLDNPLTNVGDGGWNGALPIPLSPHPRNGDGMLRLTANGSIQWLTNRWVPCNADDLWYLKALVRRTTTGSGAGFLQLAVVGQDAAGNNIGPYVAASIDRTAMTNGQWNLVEGFVGSPPGAVRMRYEVWLSSDWLTGNIDFTDFDLKRANARLLLGSEAGVHIKGESNHITVYAPGDVYPDLSRGPAKPMQVFGGNTGGAFAAFDPNSGDELGGINADGTMHTPHIAMASATLGGVDLASMLGTSGAKPVASGAISGTSHNDYSSQVGLIGWVVPEIIAGHQYRIKVTFQGSCSDAATWGRVRLRYTTGATKPTYPGNAALLNPNPTYVDFHHVDTGFAPTISAEYLWEAPADYDRLNLLFCGNAQGSGDISTRNYVFSVIDEGPAPDSAPWDAYSPPPSLPFDRVFPFADHETYSQYGLTTSQYKGYFLRHGTGGSSFYRSFLTEPAAARTLLNGGGITDIQVGLTFAQDNPVSNPWFGTWTGTAGTGTTISNGSQRGGAPTSHGQFEWISLSTAQRNAVVGGAKIAIGRTVSATLASYYGTASGTPEYRPKLRIIGSQ